MSQNPACPRIRSLPQITATVNHETVETVVRSGRTASRAFGKRGMSTEGPNGRATNFCSKSGPAQGPESRSDNADALAQLLLLRPNALSQNSLYEAQERHLRWLRHADVHIGAERTKCDRCRLPSPSGEGPATEFSSNCRSREIDWSAPIRPCIQNKLFTFRRHRPAPPPGHPRAYP
jgi:hypothetical protein